MKLSGEQVKLLQDSLLEAYDRDSLRRMMRICMEADFDDLVPNAAFTHQVYALIEWAEKRGHLQDLIRCAYAENSDNAYLQRMYALLSLPPSTRPAATLTSLPALSVLRSERSLSGRLLIVGMAAIAAAVISLLAYNSLANRAVREPVGITPGATNGSSAPGITATHVIETPFPLPAVPEAKNTREPELPASGDLPEDTLATVAFTPAATTPAAMAAPTPLGGGGSILFDRGQMGSRDIYSIAPDGSNLVNVTNNPADDWVGSLSPDGRWLLFSSYRNGNWDIYAQDMIRGFVSRLTDDSAEDHDPAWSPDGGRILFHSNRRDGVWRIYSDAVNGADVRQVTYEPGGAAAGAWSPDGSRIVYSANFARPADIYVANADGSNPVNIANTATHESTAAWSPDGTKIAFYSERDGNRELYLANADGTNPVRLTDNPAIDSMPAFSPDGRQIVFVSDRQGDMNLYRLDLETGSLVQLTTDPLPEGSPFWTR